MAGVEEVEVMTEAEVMTVIEVMMVVEVMNNGVRKERSESLQPRYMRLKWFRWVRSRSREVVMEKLLILDAILKTFLTAEVIGFIVILTAIAVQLHQIP